MRFLTPGFLALTALAAPILLLYMLRLRRREVTVSSTLLWQRLLQDREANAPWQKLRRSLLLLLQLLILAVLVFALGRPYLPVPAVASGSVALLLDASASMNTRDGPGGQTRFEAAQAVARGVVADLAAGEVMTVISAGPAPQVLIPPTADRAALREAIARAVPTAAPADWESALALASASIAGNDRAVLVIVSDGGLPADLPPLPVEVRYLPVGRADGNLAIAALAARPLDDRPQLFASVANYGPQDADVILSLEADGELLSAERLTVPAGQTTDVTLTDLPPEGQVIRAALTLPAQGGLPDPLPLDDVAYTVYAPPAGGRVLLVTEGNRFLEQIFSALPGVEAFRITPGDLPQERYDLVVLDGWLPQQLPQTNLLIVAPPSSSALFTVSGVFQQTRLARQANDPLLAFVDFSDVAIREAARVETPGWAEAVIEAEGGPLLIAGQTGGRRVAILTFDLHASNLPLKISYPILMANLLDWFAPASVVEAAASSTPGAPVLIRPQAAATAYRITRPDGTRQVIPVAGGSLTFTGTEQLGVYTVDLLEGDQVVRSGRFVVNLFSSQESRIAPAEAIQIGQSAVSPAAREQESGQRPLWPWFAAAALAVLALEWWVYHRGTMIPRPVPARPVRRNRA